MHTNPHLCAPTPRATTRTADTQLHKPKIKKKILTANADQAKSIQLKRILKLFLNQKKNVKITVGNILFV